MSESKVVYNNSYTNHDEPTKPILGETKAIFERVSSTHIAITAVDPEHGTSIEVVVYARDLPDFVRNPNSTAK